MGRFTLLSILIYALLFLGLLTLNGGLVALAIPLVVYLAASLFFRTKEPRLKGTRSLSAGSVLPGRPVVVGLSVVNEGPALEEVRIEDVVPASLEVVEGVPRVMAALPAGGAIELEYTVRGGRGSFEFGEIRTVSNDHQGLMPQRLTLSAPARLLVLPVVQRLRQIPIRPLRTRAYAGPIPARQGGGGVAFFGVRAYQPGDVQRRINWRLSARRPRELFVNEFEQERIADVGLILDARQRCDVRVGGASLFEHSVAAAASLAVAFLNDGNRVGLTVYGEFLSWIFPGYGKVQRKRILEALARARTGKSLAFETFNFLPTRFFPPKSQIVLVSPLCADDVQILIGLVARGYQLLLISPDPVRFEVGLLGEQPGVVLAGRIARLERALRLRRLRRAGIQVVDWPVDRPLEQVVHALVGRVPGWFRAVGRGPL